MEKIGIITDSAADLSKNEIFSDITRIVPLKIAFSNGEYKDGVTISSDEVYRRMDTEIPKTSLPDGQDMISALEGMKSEGFTHIIGIFISTGLSGTYNAFLNIQRDYEKEMVIKSLDSKNLSMGEGVLVKLAQDMIKDGKSFDEIYSTIENKQKKLNTYFVLDTLEYLIKGGRIGKVAGTIGQLLNIKPIIHVNKEGIYHSIEKARGKKQSVSKLIEYLRKNHISKGPHNVYLVHGGVPEEAEELMKVLKDDSNVKNIDSRPLTPSLSVHTGKGLLGVIVEEL